MPKPKPGESQKDYVSRCIPIRQKEHPGEDVKQSAAVCYSMYRQAKEGELIDKIDFFLKEKEKEKPQDFPCEVCGKPLGNEVFLGSVHGKCARQMHRKVLGKKR